MELIDLRSVIICFGIFCTLLPHLLIFFFSNESSETTEPWQCDNNSCREISLRNSSAISTFEKFSLDSSSALFVHFTAYNVSLKPSNGILDPLNLVWVESIDAPFLSLDLGFNVYSLGLLSQKVHHMTVIIEEDAQRCLWNMNYTCATETLSTAYLQHVTKGRGVLCHTINHKKSLISVYAVTYQCCRENHNSRQIECDIPVLISSDLAAIFKTVLVVAAIALSYFPVLWVSFPDEDSSKTLSYNTHICINLAYQIVRHIMKAVRRKCASYWADIVKTIIIGLFMPIFYYFYLIQRLYIMKYEIPKMFNDDVKDAWDYTIMSEWSFFVLYIIGIPFFASLHYPKDMCCSGELDVPSYSEYLRRLAKLEKAEKDFKINWMIPVNKTQAVVGLTCRWIGLPNWIVIILKIFIWLPCFCFFLLCYAISITATTRSIDFLLQHYRIYRQYRKNRNQVRNRTTNLLPLAIAQFCATYSIGRIIWCSLLIISRLIVYVYMGLVATKDDFLPMFTLIFVFGYYVWHCFNYESQKYQKLLEQTFEKCKKQQEGQTEPTIDPPLQFDEEGAPIISTKLFQKVIDKILPLSEVYTNMFLKITTILSFLLLTYFSIMVYGKSSLNDYTKALAIFLGAIIPKLVEIFRDNSSKLLDIENSYKIEKIVKDFINSNAIPRDLPELSSNESQNEDCAIELTTCSSRNDVSLQEQYRYLREIDLFPSNDGY